VKSFWSYPKSGICLATKASSETRYSDQIERGETNNTYDL